MITFGSFELLPERQILLESDRPVPLGGRAFLLLLALVERAGELVDKDTLIALVWPDTIVEECNLRSHVAALRRILGCGKNGHRYIATVSGRGYRFVAPVTTSDPPSHKSAAFRPEHNLPVRITSLVGRQQEIKTIREQLGARRLITLVGPGGIGKTTVALAAAHGLIADYPDGVRLIDFPPSVEHAVVPSLLAAKLGVAIMGDEPLSGLVRVLRERRMLLVIDGCEHVLAPAAALAEAILQYAPGVHVVATSREPLRAEGECLLRLTPLDTPPDSTKLSAADLLAFPAVQLFVQRATTGLQELALDDLDIRTVSDICRKLDGNALAIELGAGQIETFGLQGLASLLDDHFLLLMRGRRTALQRHQTLRDTLDWSYQLLPPEEQWLLRQLAIFVSSVSLESCCAIAGPAPAPRANIADLVAKLVAKSLISSEIGPTGPRFRLLDAARAYALDRLREQGEFEAAARRHALHLLTVLEQTGTACDSGAENLGIALDWAHSLQGDSAIALRLTLAAIPFWFSVALIDICRIRIEQAIRLAASMSSTEREIMRLHAGLAGVLMNTKGAGPELVATCNQVLALAERLNDDEYRLRGYWGLWVDRNNSGMHREALEIARLFLAAAKEMDDPSFSIAGDRMIGISLHYTGDQAGSLAHLERVLAIYALPEHSSRNIPYQFDQRVAALCHKARILLLMGFPDHAMRVAVESVAEAEAIGHLPSLAYALCEGGCPIAFAAGNLEAAEQFVNRLLEGSQGHGFELWQALGRCFDGWLRIRKGEVDDGCPRLRVALAELRTTRFGPVYTLASGKLADALGQSGALAEGLDAVDEALRRSEDGGEHWCRPELMRIKADLLIAQGCPGSRQAALALLQEARDEARRQGALTLELRICISLVRIGQPTSELESVYARFSEGFLTDDLRAARDMLDQKRMVPLIGRRAEAAMNA